MMIKNVVCCIGLSVALISVAMSEEKNALNVTNGDFSDLTELEQRAGGWYAGVPAGWTAPDPNGDTNQYAILNQSGNFVANVSTLSQIQPSFAALEQEVGELPATGEVTLTFLLEEPWHEPEFVMGVAIYDCLSSVPLAVGDFNSSGNHTLVANNVSAGTQIKIGFWRVSGFPALDDVVATFKQDK
jgi:hypothetical protein